MVVEELHDVRFNGGAASGSAHAIGALP